MTFGSHALVLALAAGSAFSTCHERPTVERTDRATSNLHPLGASLVAAPGVVTPRSGEIVLAPIEAGRIEALLVVEGDRVERGQLLVRLEDSAQRHAVEIALAEVSEARAMLDGTAPTDEAVRIAEAEMEAAAERAEQTSREAIRSRTLGSSGGLPAVEIERWDASARADTALRVAAEARLDATRRGASRADRRLARARLAAAEARLEGARAALLRREVRATITGVVLWSRRHAGEFVTPGEGPVVVLGDLERLEVRLEVDELDARVVSVGASCTLRGDGGEALGVGTVVRMAAAYGARGLATERVIARSDARVREVFVEVEPNRVLAPGQRVWGYVDRAVRHASR